MSVIPYNREDEEGEEEDDDDDDDDDLASYPGPGKATFSILSVLADDTRISLKQDNHDEIQHVLNELRVSTHFHA